MERTKTELSVWRASVDDESVVYLDDEVRVSVSHPQVWCTNKKSPFGADTQTTTRLATHQSNREISSDDLRDYRLEYVIYFITSEPPQYREAEDHKKKSSIDLTWIWTTRVDARSLQASCRRCCCLGPTGVGQLATRPRIAGVADYAVQCNIVNKYKPRVTDIYRGGGQEQNSIHRISAKWLARFVDVAQWTHSLPALARTKMTALHQDRATAAP
ncbi:12128_t:CDS:2 [Acaulospora colombiana]|uniref:12128_t:CDS:1 n=1 Tax=Acaulospora colombiana TaxID=27376 RepID=A0ACA9LVB7_9GLOM|nr:12128_t:CDS:2 [Acaulospora colombiana]